MAWKIRLSERVDKALSKLDKQTAKRITKKLREISQLDDPRSTGKALSGHLSGLWRYRVDNYRIICDIKDDTFVILAVYVGHRSKIYKTIKHMD